MAPDKMKWLWFKLSNNNGLRRAISEIVLFFKLNEFERLQNVSWRMKAFDIKQNYKSFDY